MSRHVFVLGDQLNRSSRVLRDAEPARTRVLMFESDALARALPHHKQKLALVFSAMRHFARSLEEEGFEVVYRRGDSFEGAVTTYVEENAGATLELLTPTDWGYGERLRRAAEGAGGRIRLLPNDLWLTTEAEFDEWADGRKSWRLEHFYRAVRRARGWLMDGDTPAGGRWNFDADNRQTPEPGHAFPRAPRFEPDDLTTSVIEEVEADFPDHFGTTRDFAWPVTRADALSALDDFLMHRLVGFGPYEDAMVEGESALYHSLLSPAMNLGLLHPLEVCERALLYADDPANDVPLQSIEGFLRQILGWREFIRHVYRRSMPGLRTANGLGHTDPLPDVYWGGDTEMRCVAESVRQLRASGHTHHIQRLMVLGNLALIARVDPRELNDWFLACYVDALDWVVTPNVMGMSQFADLGGFTSKPYAAGGKYISRMSDHCAGCAFDVKKTVGDDACPLNSMYWDFIDHHSERFANNPRMAMIVGSWQRRGPDSRRAVLDRASAARSALAAGSL